MANQDVILEGYSIEELDEFVMCPRCGCCEIGYESCWQCFGAGGFDIYAETPLEAEPGEWEHCEECLGVGTYPVCGGGCWRDSQGLHHRGDIRR